MIISRKVERRGSRLSNSKKVGVPGVDDWKNNEDREELSGWIEKSWITGEKFLIDGVSDEN